MGLYDLRIDGSVTWANSHYWTLLGTEKPDSKGNTASLRLRLKLDRAAGLFMGLMGTR